LIGDTQVIAAMTTVAKSGATAKEIADAKTQGLLLSFFLTLFLAPFLGIPPASALWLNHDRTMTVASSMLWHKLTHDRCSTSGDGTAGAGALRG
jgi:hypothetical protein